MHASQAMSAELRQSTLRNLDAFHSLSFDITVASRTRYSRRRLQQVFPAELAAMAATAQAVADSGISELDHGVGVRFLSLITAAYAAVCASPKSPGAYRELASAVGGFASFYRDSILTA